MPLNKEIIQMYEQMLAMGSYYSSGRPVYVNPKIIVNDICTKISLNKNDLVLDVGCNAGLLTIPLAKKCKYIYALDASKKILEKAKENCRKKKIANIAFFQGLVTKLPFKNHSFNKVVMYAVIHFLENKQQMEKCIKELIRVCKPGGRILIGEIPDMNLIKELSSRKKSKQETDIINNFINKRKEYDRLFKTMVTVKPGKNSQVVDIEFLLKLAQKNGVVAKIGRQNIKLPFSLTRTDLILYT